MMSQSITKASVPPPTVPTFAPLVEGPAAASEAEAARCFDSAGNRVSRGRVGGDGGWGRVRCEVVVVVEWSVGDWR